VQALDPKGAVAEDAWKAAVLMLKVLECLTIHKEEQWFGR